MKPAVWFCAAVATALAAAILYWYGISLFSVLVALLLLWTHRTNIERLKSGTESKIRLWERTENQPGEESNTANNQDNKEEK